MIHELPSTAPELARRLDELDRLHGELALEVGRAAPWTATLRRHAAADAVASSVAIEGFVAESVGPGSRSASGDAAGTQATRCYAHAMHHVRVLGSDPHFTWNSRVVLDLHFDACSFEERSAPGHVRTKPVLVTAPRGGHAYRAPESADVPRLVDAAMEWLESNVASTHVAIRAAMAHLHIASIHPFRDGNGRVARIAQALVMARHGILAPELASIEPVLARDTAAYYRALQQAQGPRYDPTRDCMGWLEFCVDAHIEQAQLVRSRIEDATRRWRRLEAACVERGWPDRLVIAMEQALAGHLTRATYVDEADISAPTATLDLRRLVDAALLEPRGAGRSVEYRPRVSLRDIVA